MVDYTLALELLESIKKEFLIIFIDKASSNLSLWCLKSWRTKMYEEMHNPEKYKVLETNPKSRELKRKLEFNQVKDLWLGGNSNPLISINRDSSAHAAPKMHKSGSRVITNARNYLKELQIAVTLMLTALQEDKLRFHADVGYHVFGLPQHFLILKNSAEIAKILDKGVKITRNEDLASGDFCSMYEKISHNLLDKHIGGLLDQHIRENERFRFRGSKCFIVSTRQPTKAERELENKMKNAINYDLIDNIDEHIAKNNILFDDPWPKPKNKDKKDHKDNVEETNLLIPLLDKQHLNASYRTNAGLLQIFDEGNLKDDKNLNDDREPPIVEVGDATDDEEENLDSGEDTGFQLTPKLKFKFDWTKSMAKYALLKVLKACLVTVGDTTFVQVHGIPMGISPAPGMANLCLLVFERKYINNNVQVFLNDELDDNEPKKSVARFIDDVVTFNLDCGEFMTKTYEGELPFEIAEPEHSTKLNKLCLPFLDLSISIGLDNYLSYSTYDKRSDYGFFINRLPYVGSIVHSMTNVGVVCTQIHRFFITNGNVQSLLGVCEEFFADARQHGYNNLTLRKAINKAVDKHWSKPEFAKFKISAGSIKDKLCNVCPKFGNDKNKKTNLDDNHPT